MDQLEKENKNDLNHADVILRFLTKSAIFIVQESHQKSAICIVYPLTLTKKTRNEITLDINVFILLYPR